MSQSIANISMPYKPPRGVSAMRVSDGGMSARNQGNRI
jgi:hypothetical protein